VTFPFICSNIPAVPAYGVYISQLIRYSRACGSYQDFLDRGLLLTRKLLNQWFLLVKLKSSLRKFYGRHHDLVDRYGISVSQMTRSFPHSWLITGFAIRITRRGATSGIGAPEFTPVFSGVRVTRFFIWCVCFVDRCLSFCPFSFGHYVVCSSSIYGF
jgi:hypothetical protein